MVVLAQRVQAGLHSSVGAGLAAAVRSEGVRGLFRGYKAQVLRDVTYHAVQLPLYEAVKALWIAGGPAAYARRLLRTRGPAGVEDTARGAGRRAGHDSDKAGGASGAGRRLAPWESMACGATAGAASGALTTPLDVIKTRMMTAAAGPGSARPRMAATIRAIWAAVREGDARGDAHERGGGRAEQRDMRRRLLCSCQCC